MGNFGGWMLLSESKQVIVGMGFPEVISVILYEKFGKLAPLIAKWYKEYNATGTYYQGNANWWQLIMQGSLRPTSIYHHSYLYAATTDPDTYRKAAEEMEVRVPPEIDGHYLIDQRYKLLRLIKEEFLDESFFRFESLIKDISSGKLLDVATYKRLEFRQAQMKYERRNHFQETPPLKIYPNGFKWINVGTRSSLVGKQLSNCGSTGVMSLDKDRTMIVLFGPNNKAHVVVTYSPNDKKISGEEGAGSSEVKEQYHDYVLDLTDQLGASLDTVKSKSDSLAVKYMLGKKVQNLSALNMPSPYDNYFQFQMNGQPYYSNRYAMISAADAQRAQQMIDSGTIRLHYKHDNIVKTVLAHGNMEELRSAGIHYIPLWNFRDQTQQ